MARRRIFRFIDLFSGAGGLAQGFRQASDRDVEFLSVFAVECDAAAAASYKANFGHKVFSKPIEKLKVSDLPKAEIVIGGPPCQGFSPLGKMSPTDHHPSMNRLWRHFFRVVESVYPLAFIIENVPEFLRSYEYLEVELTARKLGYDVVSGVLNAAEFEVPQRRKRGFVVGVRGRKASLPRPSPLAKAATVRDAILDLINQPLVYDLENRLVSDGDYTPRKVSELHIGRNPTRVSLLRYKCVPPGGNRFDLMKKRPDLTPECWLRKRTGSTDVFGRLVWDKPALTIRTEFFKPEKGRYLHPRLHRPITHWEAARLQRFPDDYLFCGSKIEIARQIGNAVPPKLAEAVAVKLKEILLTKPKSAADSRRQTASPVLQASLY